MMTWFLTIWAATVPLRAVVCPDGLELLKYHHAIRVGCVVAADPVYKYRDSYIVNGVSYPGSTEGLLLAIGDKLPEREVARCVAWLER